MAARVRLAAQDKTETCPSGPKGASGSSGLPHAESFDSRTECLRQSKGVERVLTYMDAYRIPVVVSWHFFCMLQIQGGVEDHGQDRSYKCRWSGSETHCKAEAGERCSHVSLRSPGKVKVYRDTRVQTAPVDSSLTYSILVLV